MTANLISVLVVEDEPLVAKAHGAYVQRIAGFQLAGIVHHPRRTQALSALRWLSQRLGWQNRSKTSLWLSRERRVDGHSPHKAQQTPR